jgi:hypothetical protein
VVVVGAVVVVGRVVVVGAVVVVGEVVVDPVVVAHWSGCSRQFTAVLLAVPPETRNPAAKMAAVRNSPMSVLN